MIKTVDFQIANLEPVFSPSELLLERPWFLLRGNQAGVFARLRYGWLINSRLGSGLIWLQPQWVGAEGIVAIPNWNFNFLEFPTGEIRIWAAAQLVTARRPTPTFSGTLVYEES